MNIKTKTPSNSPFMGRIDTLVHELCPEGVEKVKLGDVCSFVRGKTITEKDTIEGDVPVIAGGQKPSYFHNEHNKDGESITVAGSGAYAGFVSFWNVPIWVSDAFTVEPNDKAITKYVYYFLLTKQQRIFETQKGAGVPHVHGKDIANFEIPLPPLSIQQEIVSVLDSFTTLIDKMKQEVEKRKKQMEYYREKLLSIENGKCMQVSEFCELKAGKAIKTSELSETKEGSHLYPCFGGNGIRGYIARKSHTGNYAIIGRQGALCGCVNWATGDFYATEHAVVAKPYSNSSPRFLYYLFTSADLNQYKSQGAQPGLAVSNLNELTFVIPSLDKQSSIVSTLDKFESYISKLERMIALRQKQYEYYRERLLTFE